MHPPRAGVNGTSKYPRGKIVTRVHFRQVKTEVNHYLRNVDGLRACIKKDGIKYIEHEDPDIICLQEIKCSKDKLPAEIKVNFKLLTELIIFGIIPSLPSFRISKTTHISIGCLQKKMVIQEWLCSQKRSHWRLPTVLKMGR
jgi:hypothetical protein